MSFAKLSGSLLASNEARPPRAPVERTPALESPSAEPSGQSMLGEAMADAIDVARLYNELGDCIRNNDQNGVQRIFAELDGARRPLSEILAVVKSLVGAEDEPPRNRSGTAAPEIAAPERQPRAAESSYSGVPDPVRHLQFDGLDGASTQASCPELDGVLRSTTELGLEAGVDATPAAVRTTMLIPKLGPEASDITVGVGVREPANEGSAEDRSPLAAEPRVGEDASSAAAEPSSGSNFGSPADKSPNAAVPIEEVPYAKPADPELDASRVGSARRAAGLWLPIAGAALIAITVAAGPGALLRGDIGTGLRFGAGPRTVELSSPEGAVAARVESAAVVPPAAQTPGAESIAGPASPLDEPKSHRADRSDAVLLSNAPLPEPPTPSPQSTPLPATSTSAVPAPDRAIAVVASDAAAVTGEPAPNDAAAASPGQKRALDAPETADAPSALLALTPKELAGSAAPPNTPVGGAGPSLGRSEPAPEALQFLERGDRLFATGDIASARLFYERAADAGSGEAALRLGETYDPAFLKRIQLRSVPGDPELAISWYSRARELGAGEASILLQGLQAKQVGQ